MINFIPKSNRMYILIKIRCSDSEEIHHKQIAKRVKFLKNNDQEVRKVNKIIEDLLAEELKENKKAAEKQILIDNIHNLMETLNLTMQQAMDALKIPADKQKEYHTLI